MADQSINRRNILKSSLAAATAVGIVDGREDADQRTQGAAEQVADLEVGHRRADLPGALEVSR